jgi:uncharacterized protein YcfJ
MSGIDCPFSTARPTGDIMNSILKSALALAGIALSTQAAATITLYEHEGFGGRNFTSGNEVRDLQRSGLNDRASSVVITEGERWEVCENTRFGGRCLVLRPGQYGSLRAMGLDDSISSMRMLERNVRVEEQRYAPAPVAAHDYRRRKEERVFEAEVTGARAVMGAPEQRCWVEREQVPSSSSSSGQANVPGALVGAVIGGILGHQVGGGHGQDIATAGGAVAGAAIGANVGRDHVAPGYGSTHDVQRCSSVPSQTPTYWDVTYDFRGSEHRVQMAHQPGRTVTVNAQGEPRA